MVCEVRPGLLIICKPCILAFVLIEHLLFHGRWLALAPLCAYQPPTGSRSIRFSRNRPETLNSATSDHNLHNTHSRYALRYCACQIIVVHGSMDTVNGVKANEAEARRPHNTPFLVEWLRRPNRVRSVTFRNKLTSSLVRTISGTVEFARQITTTSSLPLESDGNNAAQNSSDQPALWLTDSPTLRTAATSCFDCEDEEFSAWTYPSTPYPRQNQVYFGRTGY